MNQQYNDEEYGGEPSDPEDEAQFHSEPLKGWQKKLGRADVCPCHGMTNCQLWER